MQTTSTSHRCRHSSRLRELTTMRLVDEQRRAVGPDAHAAGRAQRVVLRRQEVVLVRRDPRVAVALRWFSLSLNLTGNGQRGFACVSCAAARCALVSGSAASRAARSMRAAAPSVDDLSALSALSVGDPLPRALPPDGALPSLFGARRDHITAVLLTPGCKRAADRSKDCRFPRFRALGA